MPATTTFIQVILPLRLDWEPFYRCGFPVEKGDRVSVPFSGRSYVAVVSETGVTPPATIRVIRDVLPDATGLEKVLPEEIDFWRILAGYYLCTVGEIYRAAHPLGDTADEERAAAWTAEQERRLAAKEEELRKVRPGTRKEAALREGIARLREKLAAETPAEPLGEIPAGTSPVLGPVLTTLHARKTVLLEGRDESARTGIYLHLAAKVLSTGRSVLWLVSSNAQLRRLESAVRNAFPEALFYDRSHSPAARRKVASTVRTRCGYLVLGTRSTLLLPHHGLGLVIVDNEHDRAYKMDSAPRLSARNAALMLAREQSAAAILGSATPSLDSLYNASTGRFSHIVMPASAQERILIVDTSAEKRKRGMDGDLSLKLLDAVSRTLGKGRKVLLLVSRRGFDPELTTAALLRSHFPGKEADISAGFLGSAGPADFEGAGLICVLYAEALLGGEDFRTDERALQALRPLAWKAPLLIQARNTEHPVFRALAEGGRTDFLMEERKAFGYPPFSRMIRISVRDTSAKRLETLSQRLAQRLVSTLGNNYVTGPYSPQQDEAGTLREIRIMFPRDASLPSRKAALRSTVTDFEQEARYTGHITVDVDPEA